MEDWKGTREYFNLVRDVAQKTTSIVHYCNVMEISPYMHRKRLKTDRRYARAFQEGIGATCEKAYHAIYDILDLALGQQAQGARLEAAKFIIERQDRLYLSSLYSQGIEKILMNCDKREIHSRRYLSPSFQ